MGVEEVQEEVRAEYERIQRTMFDVRRRSGLKWVPPYPRVLTSFCRIAAYRGPEGSDDDRHRDHDVHAMRCRYRSVYLLYSAFPMV